MCYLYQSVNRLFEFQILLYYDDEEMFLRIIIVYYYKTPT